MFDLTSHETLRDINVAILDDDTIDRRWCEDALRDRGEVRLWTAAAFEELPELMQQHPIDVASVDWLYGVRKQGQSILRYLKNECPAVGRVVVTQLKNVEDDAIANGADAFLEKDKNPERYVEKICDAARIGIKRKISLLSDGKPASERSGAQGRNQVGPAARELAHEIAVGRYLEEMREDALHKEMRRIGWWGVLDCDEFRDLPAPRKLECLLSAVGELDGPLNRALQTTRASRGSGLRVPTPVPGSVRELDDDALSVLSYVMRVGGHEPAVMRHLWRAKDFFRGSEDAPPWDNQSLRGFFEQSGLAGLASALSWIRRA